MRTQSMSISEFMSGEYKINPDKKKSAMKTLKKVGTSITVPLLLAKPAFANEIAGPKQWIGEQTLSTLAHALDPVIELLVALSFPVCSVIIVGSLFLFAFGNSDAAWEKIQRAGLSYILIQLSPLFLNILKGIGDAI